MAISTLKIRMAIEKTVKRAVTRFCRDETGSLAPLVIGLFLISSLTAIVVVNYSSVVLKQRILVQNNERALIRASHEIDLWSYYTNGLDKYEVSNGNVGEPDFEYRVPIDCDKAFLLYKEELMSSIKSDKKLGSELTNSHQNTWKIDSFDCDGNSVRARVTQQTPLPFQLPLFGIYEATIHSTASAFSTTD